MFKDITERILLMFIFGAMASFIPVMMIDGTMWYVGTAHFLRMIIFSFYVLAFPTSRLLEILFQLANFATIVVAYLCTGVYVDVFTKNTTDVFKYIYVILECITIVLDLIFVYSIFTSRAKVHDINNFEVIIEQVK